MELDRTRKTFAIILGLTILVIAATFVLNLLNQVRAQSGGAGAEPGYPVSEAFSGLFNPPVEITFNSSNTKEDWINAVTATFNELGFQTASGRPIVVTVTHGNSGGSQTAILEGDLKPTMWSPGEQSWVEGAGQTWHELHGRPLFTDDCSPSVYAPIGFGMWRPMAEALGWPDTPISWDTIVDLAADPQGWGAYGHPEWGEFKFGHTHPDYSNSGLLMLTALAYDALGQTSGLTFDNVKSQSVIDAMREVELHTFHYGRQSRNLADLMTRKGPAYLHAITMTEAEVLRTNRESADIMQFPLVFIFPAAGTFWAEHPLCILDAEWVSEEEQEAARIYRDFLLAPEQQALTVGHGLRPIIDGIDLHDPLTLENGTDPRVTTDTVPALASPSAAAAAAVQDVFHQVKKKATVIVLLDTSGSMSGAKIKNATQATANFINRLESGDNIVVFTFDSDIARLQPAGEAGTVKEQLAATVSTLFARGDTILHAAVCHAATEVEALRAADEAAGERRLYGVVLLSDGDDSGSQITENDMFNCLPTGESVEGTKFFTIAFGEDADEDLLSRIANRTNGAKHAGDPDNIERVYETISAEQ